MPTKSDSIRAILAKQPDATPKTILAALKKRGIKASAALIAAIKYKAPKRTVSLAQIQAAKAFSAKMRGLDAARAALAAYGRLTDAK
ncbi:MAG: hypothetical protein WD063_08510 [Pirellulales bacterium]